MWCWLVVVVVAVVGRVGVARCGRWCWEEGGGGGAVVQWWRWWWWWWQLTDWCNAGRIQWSASRPLHAPTTSFSSSSLASSSQSVGQQPQQQHGVTVAGPALSSSSPHSSSSSLTDHYSHDSWDLIASILIYCSLGVRLLYCSTLSTPVPNILPLVSCPLHPLHQKLTSSQQLEPRT